MNPLAQALATGLMLRFGFRDRTDVDAAWLALVERDGVIYLDSAQADAFGSGSGYPSLNAFYVANRARCMCQDVNQPDDIHGFFVLVPER